MPKPYTPDLDFETATTQDVFDYVAFQLIRQGRPSLALVDDDIDEDGSLITSVRCQYRGKDGARCAAGQLLADDEIVHSIEGLPIDIAIGSTPYELESSGLARWADAHGTMPFLRDLQRAHDLYSGATSFGSFWSPGSQPVLRLPKLWLASFREQMRVVAARYGLDDSILAFRESAA